MTDLIQPIYEDNHLLAINKPSGMLSQGDKTGDEPLIELAKSYIKEKYNKPGNVFLGLCHRLDRPVSGALLLARTSKALERINRMFQHGEIQKIYWAISHRQPNKREGRLEQILLKDSHRNMVQVRQELGHGAKQAITEFRVIGSFDTYTLTELTPHTGRSHQLRVAMQTLNAPILGDLKYGGKAFDPTRICLHCRQLEFIHPVTTKKIRIIAPVPDAEPWVYF